MTGIEAAAHLLDGPPLDPAIVAASLSRRTTMSAAGGGACTGSWRWRMASGMA